MCEKNKSPGPDGLSAELFDQHFWEILRDPLYLMFNECRKELYTTM